MKTGQSGYERSPEAFEAAEEAAMELCQCGHIAGNHGAAFSTDASCQVKRCRCFGFERPDSTASAKP